jgi:hypothetical protein
MSRTRGEKEDGSCHDEVPGASGRGAGDGATEGRDAVGRPCVPLRRRGRRATLRAGARVLGHIPVRLLDFIFFILLDLLLLGIRISKLLIFLSG